MRVQTHAEFLAQRRFSVLDGVRAISVMFVFTAHPAYPEIWPAFHGPAGVTMFFALSGFLITTLLLREQDRYGRVDLTAFYVRRLFRIYPVFFLVFAIYVLLILVLGAQSDRREGFVANIPYFVLFFPEHSVFFNEFDYAIPFNGAWSIGIEEKFYLVWPVVGFALLAALPRARFAVLVALAAAFTAISVFAGPVWTFLEPYTGITYGALVAFLLHAPRTYRYVSNLGRPPVLIAAVLLFTALQFGTDEILLGGDFYAAHGVVVSLLIAGLVTTKTNAIRWLSSRPLVYTGALSYVLYLIHNFGLNAAEAVIPFSWGFPGSLLSTLLGIAGSFVVAAAIHRWFEEPLRLVGARISKRRRVSAAAQKSLQTGEPRVER